MKKNLLLFVLVLFSFIIVNAQKTKDQFKTKFQEADKYLFENKYAKAIPILEEIDATKFTNSNIKFLLGHSYLQTPGKQKKAIELLSVATKSIAKEYYEGDFEESRAPIEVFSYLGDAYHKNFEFDKAKEAYDNYMKKLNKNSKEYSSQVQLIELKKQWCDNAKKLIKNKIDIKIENLGNVLNNEYPDYSPSISADESLIIFTSRRQGSTGGKLTEDGLFFEDMYVSEKDAYGKWEQPKKMSSNINSDGHEASLNLSPDGEILLVYRDDNFDGNLYYSSKDVNNRWSALQKFGSDINTKAWESSASYSSDNNTLYFTSNREGGLGGRDIYTCLKTPINNWALSKNIGDVINTKYEEESPYIHPNGKTLFFSSQGHNSMGGFDVFKCELKEDGTWSKPENLGYPVNTTGDDAFYVITADGRRAYYASDNEGGYGEKDLYMLTNPKSFTESNYAIKGLIMYEEDKSIPQEASITVLNPETSDIVGIYKPNSNNGKFLMILEENKKFDLSCESEGNAFFSETIDVNDIYLNKGGNYVILLGKNKSYVASKTTTDSILYALRSQRIVKEEEIAQFELTQNTTISVEEKIADIVQEEPKEITEEKIVTEFIKKEQQNEEVVEEPQVEPQEIVEPKKEEKAKKYTYFRKPVIQSDEYNKIMIETLFFNFDKDNLTEESILKLKDVLALLKEYPDMQIEIMGHTDAKGTSYYNLDLSIKRAMNANGYLVKCGVNKNRLVMKFKGEIEPVALNEVDGNDTPEGRKFNRRVTISIINPEKYNLNIEKKPLDIPENLKVNYN